MESRLRPTLQRVVGGGARDANAGALRKRDSVLSSPAAKVGTGKSCKELNSRQKGTSASFKR